MRSKPHAIDPPIPRSSADRSLPGPAPEAAGTAFYAAFKQPAHGGHGTFPRGRFPGHRGWLRSRLMQHFDIRDG